MTELIETAPKRDLASEALAPVVEALRADHAIYSPLFQRRAQRDAASLYLRGVLAALPGQSIAPLVLAGEGGVPPAVRALQSFISDGRWAEERLLPQHWKAVERDLGADDGVLRGDGSDFPKQGVHWAGVKRQEGGELGKRAHGPAGVWVGYVSPTGSTWRDRRRYVPEEWGTDDAEAERRPPGGRPPESPFKTTPALAQDRLAEVVKSPCRRGRWVVMDEACGNDPGVLEGMVGLGRWYCAEVPQTTRVWRERPTPHVPPWRGRGRRPQRERLGAGAPEGRPVLEIAPAVTVAAGSRQPIQDGSQGPRGAELAAMRVMAVRDALPGPDVWWGLRRPLETGAWKT